MSTPELLKYAGLCAPTTESGGNRTVMTIYSTIYAPDTPGVGERKQSDRVPFTDRFRPAPRRFGGSNRCRACTAVNAVVLLVSVAGLGVGAARPLAAAAVGVVGAAAIALRGLADAGVVTADGPTGRSTARSRSRRSPPHRPSTTPTSPRRSGGSPSTRCVRSPKPVRPAAVTSTRADSTTAAATVSGNPERSRRTGSRVQPAGSRCTGSSDGRARRGHPPPP